MKITTNMIRVGVIIFTILALSNANAYEFKYKCITGCNLYNNDCRQSEALERIAAALEWMADSYTEETALRITTASSNRVNGRSLKAVPTVVENNDESFDECLEKCWHHLMNSEIKRCIKECIKEYK